MRRLTLYSLLLAAAFILLLVLELARPRPIDWSLSWSRSDRTPYGSYVLYRLLPELFPDQPVRAGHGSVYEAATSPHAAGQNYIFIDDFFDLDAYATRLLLQRVEEGSRVFMAAHRFGESLADTLKFATSEPEAWFRSREPENDTLRLYFAEPAAGQESGFAFDRLVADAYFTSFDSAQTVVLGATEEGNANFIEFRHGAGALYLSTVPLAFTNYYLVHEENADYVFQALSHLPVRATYWDEYYKPRVREAGTPLRFILRADALRWAYYVGLTSLLFFVLFNTKRRQRVVPIVPPKVNTTLAFVDTVGRLYYEQGRHKDMAEKKITYFLEYLRSHLGIDAGEVDEQVIHRVAERSGVAPRDVEALFHSINRVRASRSLTARELIALNHHIENFYRKSER